LWSYWDLWIRRLDTFLPIQTCVSRIRQWCSCFTHSSSWNRPQFMVLGQGFWELARRCTVCTRLDWMRREKWCRCIWYLIRYYQRIILSTRLGTGVRRHDEWLYNILCFCFEYATHTKLCFNA
jgi:hypothetical protein